MNKLELTYNYKRPIQDAKAILNGEDVTMQTRKVIWSPDGAFIHLLDTSQIAEKGGLVITEIRLSEIDLIKE